MINWYFKKSGGDFWTEELAQYASGSAGKASFTGVTRKYTVKYPQSNYVLPGESPFIADIRARFGM